MFNKDFYPTPKETIEQMLLGVEIQDKIILEPSAGKGDIVDYLQSNSAKEVIACEKNNDLAKIVSSKCRLINDDFLQVRSEDISHIDLIVMNPPFSEDVKHILHAWDIAPNGCQIIALCNYETIRNRYSTSRSQLFELIELNGNYSDFGECFSDAERQTDVRVACVNLFKTKTGEEEFADFFSIDEDLDEGVQGVVTHNYVSEIVGRYVQAVNMFDSVMEASNKINEVMKPIYSRSNDSNYISYSKIVFGARYHSHENKRDIEVSRDVFKKELQKQAWLKVFAELNMDKYVTKGVRENINSFVEKQTSVPFTVKNVYKMVEIIVGTHGSRMQQVLIEAFDLICSFSSENSTAGEKWKTNSDYMVNKKFIVPYICEYDKRWDGENVKICYGRYRDCIDDINRALCLLTATNYDNIKDLGSFVRNTLPKEEVSNNVIPSRQDVGVVPMKYGQWSEWEFFKIKGFKKGTMHFEFLDEDVWLRFNTEVAKAKGWRLPKKTNTTKRKRKEGIEVY